MILPCCMLEEKMGRGSRLDSTLAAISVVSGWAAVVTKRMSVTIWILLGQADERANGGRAV